MTSRKKQHVPMPGFVRIHTAAFLCALAALAAGAVSADDAFEYKATDAGLQIKAGNLTKNIEVFGDKGQKPFRIVFVCAIALGAVLKLDLVWLLSDIGNALMAFPNILGILLLSPVLFQIVRDEVGKDPRFVL